MGLFAKGDVVVAAPESLHPILCMITSRGRGDGYDVALTKADFASGGLRIESVARICQLFTLDEDIIEYQVGKLKKEKLEGIISKIVEMFEAN
jgi:PemK-like, MazF-like toxin of type II toxin-antitoxin system